MGVSGCIMGLNNGVANCAVIWPLSAGGFGEWGFSQIFYIYNKIPSKFILIEMWFYLVSRN